MPADPISLTAAGIFTLIVTKFFEKTGENVSDTLWQKGQDILAVLQRKAPNTAKKLKTVAEQPKLADDNPRDYGIPTLVEEVESAANAHSEVMQAIQSFSSDVKQVPGMVLNLTKLTDQIGVLVQGGNVDLRGSTFN